MDNKDIIERVLSEADNFQSMSAEELKEMLDKELSKPDDQIDYEFVDELTMAVIESEGKEHLAADIDTELNKLQERTSKHNRIIRFPKWAIGLSAACVILFCANCISVSAWDMNVFSAVIEFTRGGFSVDFGKNESEIIELTTSEDDPYGIIAECAKYDIYPETPHYLPAGFELALMTNNINDYANYIKFVFRNANNESITFEITRYWDNIGQIGIPSDKYNISETIINGNTAIVSKEDNQYTIAFQNEKTVFLMFTQDVDYAECEKIVDSIN